MRDLPEGDSIPRLSWGHGNPQQVLAGVWAAKWEAGTEVRCRKQEQRSARLGRWEKGAEVPELGTNTEEQHTFKGC